MIPVRIAQMRTGDRRGVLSLLRPPSGSLYLPPGRHRILAARSPPDLPAQIRLPCRYDWIPGKVGPMATTETAESLVNVLRDTIVALVRQDGPDLSARQFGVFLTCYLEGDPQTVRGLAATLDVSKPVISRALDRLADFDLVRRKADPTDRRSVLVQRTPAGTAYLKDIRGILRDASNGKTRR
jgi:DNA-binding MarR family transcriptional regulator